MASHPHEEEQEEEEEERCLVTIPDFQQQYKLMHLIAENKTTKVYQAYSTKYHKLVALKMYDKCPPTTFISSQQRKMKRQQQEIEALRTLNHPNIVPFIESFQTKTKVMIITEFVDGGDLQQLVMENGSIDEAQAAVIFLKILRGVCYCHRKNVVHRDIKPENILISTEGNVYLTDFGASGKLDASGRFRDRVGTPEYAAPEVMARENKVAGIDKGYSGLAVDSWGLGMVLYSMLFGKTPFKGSNFEEMRRDICDCNYTIPDNVSALCRDLLHNTIHADPEKRLKSWEILNHPWCRSIFASPLNRTPVRHSSRPEDSETQRVLGSIENIYQQVDGKCYDMDKF